MELYGDVSVGNQLSPLYEVLYRRRGFGGVKEMRKLLAALLLISIGASLLPDISASKTLPLVRLGTSELDEGWVVVGNRSGVTNIAIELNLKGALPNVKYTLFFVGTSDGTPVQVPLLILLTNDVGTGTERTELALPRGSYQGQFQVRLNAIPVFATPETTMSL